MKKLRLIKSIKIPKTEIKIKEKAHNQISKLVSVPVISAPGAPPFNFVSCQLHTVQ